ncbi:conserved protein of unknown function [Streptantibioticus cattleyicolor NRRL 8057 = DSM 46488]|nr:hypothetical protein [Streptomyces sp. SID5468]MYS58045.1 hypothetical protein [Streptomyces sp. SID5468]CCB73687.1 conserved protein of unknown function [Streptantibioticus cattleyicolor NRRL 8057 = DSM 46488]
MRAPHDSVTGSSTPIYDALCSEYRRLFRALPGDRTGEEHFSYESWTPWERYGPRPAPPPPVPPQPYHPRHRGMVRAALPPGPSGGPPGPYDNRPHGR